jgi:hypothetical protein
MDHNDWNLINSVSDSIMPWFNNLTGMIVAGKSIDALQTNPIDWRDSEAAVPASTPPPFLVLSGLLIRSTAF